MDTALIIITLVLSALSRCLSAVLLILLLKRSKGDANPFSPEAERRQIQSQAEIKGIVDNLQASLPLKMETEITNLSSKITSSLNQQSQENNKQFLLFQSTLNESVTNRFAQITAQESEQMQAIHKTLDAMSSRNEERITAFQNSFSASVKDSIKEMNERLSTSLKEINDKVDSSLAKGFENTSNTMQSLQKQLGAVEEAQKNLANIQSEIASLNGVLTSNQQRGKYGEWQLELLLENLFQDGKGTLYEIQYNLGDGLRPDAVVFLDGKAHHQMVCIDSKFSLNGYESLFDPALKLSEEETKQAKAAFKAALKSRIDETSKYVVPGKTISNALMFIPSDGVFAFVEKEYPDLVELAKQKRVVMVCPCIMTPLLGSFRVIQLDAKRSESLVQINEALNRLGKDFKNFIPRWENLNKSIQGLTKKSDEFSTTVRKIGTKFENVQQIKFENGESKGEELPDDDLPEEITEITE